MIDKKLLDKSKCCGCSACVCECPVNCITMKFDEEGFLYPIIDKTKCIGCNRCEKVCPILFLDKLNNNEVYSREAFAAINKNITERINSSSGGIFSALAKYVIEAEGVVYGAAFDKDYNVVHMSISDKNDIWKLQGSKYVQSKVEDNYQKAEKDLLEKKIVLFTGTPCQIAGLKSYLKKDYGNLICQDIICHGVPSPKVWEKYIAFREKKSCSKVNKIFFRNKKYGWKTYSVLFKYLNNTEYAEIMSLDLYMRLFLKNLTLRPSCYNCSFKRINQVADITLADFWGIEELDKKMFDNLGTSLVIIHSKKGKELYLKIRDKILSKKVELNKAISYNTAMIESVSCPKERKDFFEYFNEKGFDKKIEKFVYIGFLRKLKRKIIAEKNRKKVQNENNNCSSR